VVTNVNFFSLLNLTKKTVRQDSILTNLIFEQQRTSWGEVHS